MMVGRHSWNLKKDTLIYKSQCMNGNLNSMIILLEQSCDSLNQICISYLTRSSVLGRVRGWLMTDKMNLHIKFHYVAMSDVCDLLFATSQPECWLYVVVVYPNSSILSFRIHLDWDPFLDAIWNWYWNASALFYADQLTRFILTPCSIAVLLKVLTTGQLLHVLRKNRKRDFPLFTDS